MSERPVWIYPAIALAAAGAIAAGLLASLPSGGQPGPSAVRVSGEAQVGGPFTLVNHHGETVTDADFRGRAMLIYFGFTYCPDVCPMSLQIMAAALERLPERQREMFQPLLISVDPERDTPEALAEYVQAPAFPENLVGLTGSSEQIREAAQAYRVYYRRVDDDGTLADYTMDHTSIIYLMDAEGRFVDVFPHAAEPERIAARLQHFLQETGAS